MIFHISFLLFNFLSAIYLIWSRVLSSFASSFLSFCSFFSSSLLRVFLHSLLLLLNVLTDIEFSGLISCNNAYLSFAGSDAKNINNLCVYACGRHIVLNCVEFNVIFNYYVMAWLMPRITGAHRFLVKAGSYVFRKYRMQTIVKYTIDLRWQYVKCVISFFSAVCLIITTLLFPASDKYIMLLTDIMLTWNGVTTPVQEILNKIKHLFQLPSNPLK